MVYIRTKTVKGIAYAYLVKSEWDIKRGSSIQRTIKYLGRADSVAIDDIPKEYRIDPKILSFLSHHSLQIWARKERVLEKLRAELFEALCNADREKATEIAHDYRMQFSLIEFYEDLLTPILYRVGDLWAEDRLSIATEHVCSNISEGLIQAMNNAINKTKGKKSTAILLTSPNGELHHLAPSMLESILLQKGYDVYNATPSTPIESILSCISTYNPRLIMISITLQENVGAARRLANRIREKYQDMSILIGGQAIRRLQEVEKQKISQKISKIMLIQDTSLEKIIRTVKVLTTAA